MPKAKRVKKVGSKMAGVGSLIRCECGFEILLLPDLKTMARAVEDHSAVHGKEVKDPVKAVIEEERILAVLNALVLIGAADS